MKIYSIRFTTEMPVGKKSSRPEIRQVTVSANSHGEAQQQVRDAVGLIWFIESRFLA